MNKPMSQPETNSATGQRICFVYKEDYPWDVRVEKILKTLSAAGHDLSLICRNTKRLAREEQTEEFSIHRLPALSALGGKLANLFSIPFYFNPFWFYWMLRYTRAIKPQVLIIRDLPLMPLGILVGKIVGARVIFDMAECYPEMYASTMQFSDNKLVKFLFKNPGFAGLMEKFSFRHAAHVFVMIEESRDRLIRLGADPDRITIVSNTPSTMGTEKPRRHGADEVLRLLYVGFVTRIRGTDNVLHGLRAYLDSQENPVKVEFDVIGIGAALSGYRELCHELDLDDHVNFHGWCSQEFVDELYDRSDVGVLTYHVCSHWNHTIPNKLFDYMLAGMPVLATNVGPIKRIVEDVECGLIFNDNDADGFAQCLAALTDAELRNRMAGQGTEAVTRQYNWEVDTARMLEALKGVSA